MTSGPIAVVYLRINNRYVRYTFFACLTLFLLAIPAYGKDLVVTGWIEDGYLLPEKLRIRAKIDTGARHSSLNAANAVLIEANGEKRVKFDVTSRYGGTITIQRPVHRVAVVKRHSGQSQRRPVIFLDLCLGGVTNRVEVNLIDRTEFRYQLLIGRSFLRGKFLVDPGKTDLLKERCD